MFKKTSPKIKPKVVAPTAPPVPEKPKTAPTPNLVRGFKDILPADDPLWSWMFRVADSLARAYGFGWIETPIVEETALFVRGVGKHTDIVEKEMFTFPDRSGQSLTLRPEHTASLARAYIVHGMVNQPQPVKFVHFGPLFRYERPQAGRYRQFHQFDLDTIGDEKPIADAELVIAAMQFFRELGLPAIVHINSIGCKLCRDGYRTKLIEYYQPRRRELCENCKKRLQRNPLRLLDCKEEKCVAKKTTAPQTLDHICEACKNHFMKVLEYLDDRDYQYQVDPWLVRGIDYYSRTVFEFFATEAVEGAQSALGSGGRYDYLIETLGGRPTPAVGVSFGFERIISRLREKNASPPEDGKPKVFLAQLGEPAKRKAFQIFDDLRRAGIPLVSAFTKDSLKAQMELAGRYGVRYTLILGQKEILEGTILLRDMEAGVQEIVDQQKIVNELQKKFSGKLTA